MFKANTAMFTNIISDVKNVKTITHILNNPFQSAD